MTDSGNDQTARQPIAFISHHSSQVETARRLKGILGHQGITGWMAPDDIDPGQPFDKAIVDQVRRSDLIILLFCGQSDQSRHVKRELMMAENSDKLIYPVRLEEKPADGLAYWLNDYQWIDWLDGDDDTITRMTDTIKRQAGRKEPEPIGGGGAPLQPAASLSAADVPPPSVPPAVTPQPPPPPPQQPNRFQPIVIAVIIGLTIMGSLAIVMRGDEPDEVATPGVVAEPEIASIDGNSPQNMADPEPAAPPPQQPITQPAPAPTPAPAPATSGSFYVVVGSFQPGDRTALRRARRFRACTGIEPIVARSDNYPGFAPGFIVVMTGSYPDAAAANQALVGAQTCVADAYVRSIGG